MQTAKIAIVGAGLAGLYAAFRLERMGMTDYILLEARDAPGGRIASVEGFDLGAAWFWPGYQRQLDELVRELGLARFEQDETGIMMMERSRNERPFMAPGFESSPKSMRLAGGMAALAGALQRRIDPARIVTGQAVRRIACVDGAVEVESGATGHAMAWRAGHVLLALPPRLAVQSIAFAPALPSALAAQWRHTATWMAPHAKYLAIYEAPFWRALGLSGQARSASGPLGEIHDASLPDGRAALFGFFGVPAGVRQRVPDAEMRALCRAQLVRLFGATAATPLAEFIKDWASDPFTATGADLQEAAQHAGAPPATAADGPWRGRLTGIASEWSPQFPGYLAGAIDAASRGIQQWEN
jgi:monoamine oxidase